MEVVAPFETALREMLLTRDVLERCHRGTLHVMGMILSLVTVRDSTIQRLLADPPLVWKLVAPDDPDAYENELAASGRAASELELLEGEGWQIDLDKSGHGIHYLLTGSDGEGDPPLNLLVSGGKTIGDIEVGYGPARALTSQQVQIASKEAPARSAGRIRHGLRVALFDNKSNRISRCDLS